MTVNDLSIEDLDRSEAMLRESLGKICAAAGCSPSEIDATWNAIVEATNWDFRIEDL